MGAFEVEQLEQCVLNSKNANQMIANMFRDDSLR
jgi:hypothetical protein